MCSETGTTPWGPSLVRKAPQIPSLNPFILLVGRLRPRGEFECLLRARCFKAITHLFTVPFGCARGSWAQ